MLYGAARLHYRRRSPIGFLCIRLGSCSAPMDRAMDSLEARPLSGSESPSYAPLFWSPDSRYIAFYDAGTLKKIGMSGGDAEPVCNLTGVAVGGCGTVMA